MEEEKREKPKATFEGEKLKELTEGETDVISDVINPNGLPVQNGLDVDVKEYGYDSVLHSCLQLVKQMLMLLFSLQI